MLNWRATPDRFLTGQRAWLPRWRFQPTENLDDAFRLLEESVPRDYSMGDDGSGFVRVRIGKAIGEAREKSKARAISFAIARAIGIDVGTSD